jgi:hypothetical protein
LLNQRIKVKRRDGKKTIVIANKSLASMGNNLPPYFTKKESKVESRRTLIIKPI